MKDPGILSLVTRRRSVRKFKKRRLSKARIQAVLEAGRWAPSGLNNQPWRFCVVEDKGVLSRLASFTKYGYIIKNAPAAIVVCMDIGDSYNREKDLLAMGACIENMLLEAASLKIGSCWLGEILNKREEVSRSLDLDEDLEIMAVVALGYPLKTPSKKARRPLSALLIKTSSKIAKTSSV